MERERKNRTRPRMPKEERKNPAETTRQDWFKCLDIMRVSKLDFDDSLVVACMMSNGANKINQKD
ncbi:MAG: hypothetical protein ACRECH_16395 [Nitrososphaerales archaeon]